MLGAEPEWLYGADGGVSEHHQATCERGFAAMEETHQKVVEDLQRQHQREVSKLLEERERLLAEETAATIFGEETKPTSRSRLVNS